MVITRAMAVVPCWMNCWILNKRKEKAKNKKGKLMASLGS